MSFPRYPAHKDSGVECLGEVPKHWDVKPLKRLADIQTGLAKGKKVEPEGSMEVPFLRVANVQDGFLDLNDIHTIQIPETALDRYLLRPGDVLMNEGGDFDKLGRGCIWNGEIRPCIHQNHVFAVRPHSISSAWLNVYTSSKQANSYFIGRSKQSTNLASISSSNLMDLPVPVAPIVESTQILSFLDHETAKIDTLITKQQRLIELLQEKRQAVISHAVTKGLNPDAPMKDSGVEWLGLVPAHWELKRLKHISPSLTVGIVVDPSSYVTDDGLPCIFGGELREGVFDWENSRRISSESSTKQSKTQLRAGDLLMVRVGAPGVTAVVPAQCQGGNCASVMLIRQGLFSSQWLCCVLNTRIVRFQVEVVQYGAAQEQFNISHAVNFWVPMPPREEQDLIAAALAPELKRTDSLMGKAQHAIDLLQERRSALISAAVTGQIDVRGLVDMTEARN